MFITQMVVETRWAKKWVFNMLIFIYLNGGYIGWTLNWHVGKRLTRRVPLVEQELLTLPEHLSSPPVFNGVRVTRSLVLYVCFVDHHLSFCPFTFGHCVVCPSLIYGFWLPLWYLQTLLSITMKKKFKQWRWTIPPTEQSEQSPLTLTHWKKGGGWTTIYISLKFQVKNVAGFK